MENWIPFIQENDLILWVILALMIIPVALPLYRKIRDHKRLTIVTSLHRGTRSEREIVLKLLRLGIPPGSIFHDLYVLKKVGEFSQIDVVVITKVGLLVFEVKEYNGWIFGNGGASNWTQTLAKKGIYKNKFYNPIKQNEAHIKALRLLLGQDENIPVFSIIVFSGKCVLKEINFVPAGTFVAKSSRLPEVIKMILRGNPAAFYKNEAEVIRVLRDSVLHGGHTANQSRHNENIKDMLGEHRVFK